MNFNEQWNNGVYTHDDVEAAIKAKVSELETAISEGGTDLQSLRSDVQNLKTQINNLPSWAKQSTKPSYNANEIGGVGGYANLLAKLNAMDEAIADAAASGGEVDLSDYYTKTQVDNLLGTKANDNEVVKSITVNGQTQTPNNGNVNIEVSGAKGDDGITPHIGQNGHWWVGPETDSENDTGIIAQGPAGTSITDAELVIAQTPTGQGDVLGMGGARIIKSNVDLLYSSVLRLYNKLANMAFWDAEDKADAAPTALDWSVPKVIVTITNSIGAGAVIKRNGVAVGGNFQVDQGDPLTLTIEAADGYTLSNVAATIDGSSATLTEANGVYTLAIAHVNASIAIVISGSGSVAWETVSFDDETEGGQILRYGLQQGRSINGKSGTIGGFATDGVSGGASIVPLVVMAPAGYLESQKLFTTGNYGNTNPGKTAANYFPVDGKRYLYVTLDGVSDTNQYDYAMAVGCYADAVIGNGQGDTDIGNALVDGFVGRINYINPNDGELGWKFDLNTFATENGYNAGDITYVKLLLVRRVKGTTDGTDSRDWISNITIKYRVSND